MTDVSRRAAVAAALCLAAAALSGCDDAGEATPAGPASTLTCPVDAAKPLTLVVGARAASPRPDLPQEVQTLVRLAAQGKQKVQVVRIDGEPSVALTAVFQSNAENDTRRGQELQTFVSKTLAVVKGLKPKVAEADVLGALTEAARITPQGGTVVLIDSGLTTVGPLSFKDSDMFGAEPADAAAYLRAQELMPALSGMSVVLVGIGNTAEPQAQLDEKLHGRVVKLWRTIAEKAGAVCVEEMQVASRRAPFETDLPVSTVPLPPPPTFKPCGTTVLADADSVGFIVDTAKLRDPEAGRRTLQQLADQLSGNTQRVLLIGNTSSEGSAQRNRELSRQRAEAIKAALVELGVSAGRIKTRGDGSTGRYAIDDTGPGGVLIPAKAAHNRSVVVELQCQG